jgi:hypothetical protein
MDQGGVKFCHAVQDISVNPETWVDQLEGDRTIFIEKTDDEFAILAKFHRRVGQYIWRVSHCIGDVFRIAANSRACVT